MIRRSCLVGFVLCILTCLSVPARAEDVILVFSPAAPIFHAHTTRQVEGQTIYGHSEFVTTMTNTSDQPVVMDSVMLTSIGTGAKSGLGDIKDYWNYGNSKRAIGPGQSVQFSKVWGFTIDPQHEWLTYVFDVCWRKVGTDGRYEEQQCTQQVLDLVSESGATRTGPGTGR